MLCLYGQPRFFFSNDTLIRNILETNKNDGLDIEVCFHTWWDELAKPKTYYEIAPWAVGSHERDMSQLDMSTYNIHFLFGMYQPISYKIDPPRDFSKQVLYQSYGVNKYIKKGNVMSQYYSTKKSSELVTRKTKFVIRARFDTFIENPLHVSDYFNDEGRIPSNTLIIPDNCHNDRLYNDNFSISDYSTHQKVCAIYDYVQEYLDDGVPYLAEELFYHHICKMGIRVVKDSNIVQMFFRGVNYVHP